MLVDRDTAVQPRDQLGKGGRVQEGVDVTALTSNGGRSVSSERNERRAIGPRLAVSEGEVPLAGAFHHGRAVETWREWLGLERYNHQTW